MRVVRPIFLTFLISSVTTMEAAKASLSKYINIPEVPVLSIISRITPNIVATTFSSVVDTMKWLWDDDSSEKVLDLEVMRTLQQGYTPSPPPARELPSTLSPPARGSGQRRRSSTNRVRWSPVTEIINDDGVVQKSPLRPCAEPMVVATPQADYLNVRLFPLVSVG
jgi:hypothetical protein